MRRTAVRAILIAALGALLLTAAACGGDDDESAADTQAPAAATTDEADTTEGETEGAETEAAEEPDFAGTENCKEFQELGAKVSAALGGTGADDADATKELLNEFADDGPEEIRDDLRVIADAYSKIADALADLELEPGETPNAEDALKLQEIAGEIDQAELTEANTNITAWVSENCTSE
jgi:hypothetical protein